MLDLFQIFYTLFLCLFTVVVLTELKPVQEYSMQGIFELIIWAWACSLFIEGIRQVCWRLHCSSLPSLYGNRICPSGAEARGEDDILQAPESLGRFLESPGYAHVHSVHAQSGSPNERRTVWAGNGSDDLRNHSHVCIFEIYESLLRVQDDRTKNHNDSENGERAGSGFSRFM